MTLLKSTTQYKRILVLLAAGLQAVQVFSLELGLDKNMFNSEKFSFRIDSFVDERLNKEAPVGFTKIGLKNKTEDMVLPADFGNYCRNFFSTALAQASGELRFIAVIQQLTVQELVVSGNEVSDASLSVDYYLWDEKSQTRRLFYRSYYKSIAGPVLDATKKHAKNLSNAFLVSFRDLSAYAQEKGAARANFVPLQSPAKDTILQDGLYYSLKQLLMNKPDPLGAIAGSVDTATLENYLDAEMFAPLSTACALVKNGTLYVCIRKNVYHKAVPVFGSRKLKVLDIQNKKSSLKDYGYIINFGIVGALIVDVMNLSGKDSVLLMDMESGLMLE